MGATFGLLGAVEAWAEGDALRLGHARQRCVLAALLVERGQPLSINQLVYRVWGEEAPRQARETLYGYVSRLRKALDPTSTNIERTPSGYLVAIDPMSVDLHRFRQLASSGTDNPGRLAALEEALGLWRGEALARLDGPWATALRRSLERERFAAELDRNDVGLVLGRHNELLPAMLVLAETHSLDERLAAQVMLGLYRAGRQAAALDHYQRIRHRLTNTLGADPGHALRELHQRILTADQQLLLTVDPTRGQATTAGSAIPRQLPASPWLFNGRVRELAELDKWLDDRKGVRRSAEVVVIAGAGGTGKTWLAMQWAHNHADRFPHGQLYVDLHGFDPVVQPLRPSVVIRGFLHALGVDPQTLPNDQQTGVGLYRSLVADRRLLILLDNARDADQVLPLLPGGRTCTVVITSRSRLLGLTATHGARVIDLGLFDRADARDLITGQLGRRRVAAEPTAVAELIDHCGGLPLALRIVAARAAHPVVRLADLAAELRETTSRLDTFDIGSLTTNLRAVFSASHQALSSATASLFVVLGHVPGSDIGTEAAASLAGLPVARTRALLRDLVVANLVQSDQPGRYRMHDLLRLYAIELSDQADTDAPRRLVDFYLHTAFAAERLLHPHRLPIEMPDPAPGCVPERFGDEESSALEWLTTEHANVLAAQRVAVAFEWHDRVWRLAWVLDTFHRRRGHLDQQLDAWRTGMAACRRIGDPTPIMLAHRNLGIAYIRADRHDEALDHLRQSLELTVDQNDLANQAHNHLILAYAWERGGDEEQALRHATLALPLFEAVGTPVWLAQAHNQVARYAARLGRPDQARDHSRTALDLFREHGDRDGEADTLSTLAQLAQHTGRHPEAISHYEAALGIRRELGHAYGEADILEQLGEIHSALSRHDDAERTWRQAVSLFTTQRRTADAQRLAARLAAN